MLVVAVVLKYVTVRRTYNLQYKNNSDVTAQNILRIRLCLRYVRTDVNEHDSRIFVQYVQICMQNQYHISKKIKPKQIQALFMISHISNLLYTTILSIRNYIIIVIEVYFSYNSYFVVITVLYSFRSLVVVFLIQFLDFHPK